MRLVSALVGCMLSGSDVASGYLHGAPLLRISRRVAPPRGGRMVVTARFVGPRKIFSSPPLGRDDDTHALLDARNNIPILTGYFGFQIGLPGIAKCPPEAQWNPPWYTGGGQSGGFCPSDYWNLAPLAVGAAVLVAAVALSRYGAAHRLLIDPTGVSLARVDPATLEIVEPDTRPLAFAAVEEWYGRAPRARTVFLTARPARGVWRHPLRAASAKNARRLHRYMTPFGLVVEAGGATRLFPLFYDFKSAEALMEEAMSKVR